MIRGSTNVKNKLDSKASHFSSRQRSITQTLQAQSQRGTVLTTDGSLFSAE